MSITELTNYNNLGNFLITRATTGTAKIMIKDKALVNGGSNYE